MSVGARIRASRRAAGLTQQQLAKRLETDSITVSRWERDQSEPRGFETIELLCDALGVSVAWLVTGKPEHPATGTDGV